MEHDEMRNLGSQEASRWILEGSLSVRRLAGTLRGDLSALEGICRRLEQSGQENAPAVSWLLDHRYLVRRVGADASGACRGGLRLPALGGEERQLRIQRVGRAMAELEEVSAQSLAEFLEGIQETEPLTEEEMDLLPQALAGGLIAALRREVEAVEQLADRGEETQALEPALRSMSPDCGN